MSLITFNGDNTIQPTGLKEGFKQKVVDRTSIKGIRHRYWLSAKYTAEIQFTALSQSQFAFLSIIFYNRGAGVTYANPNSGLTFFGYPTVVEAEYYKGSTYLKDMSVTLEQA